MPRPSAIAVAALFDPPLVLTARSRPRLAVIASATGRPRGRSESAIDWRAILRADFEVARPDPDAAAAIVIGDRYPLSSVRISAAHVDCDP